MTALADCLGLEKSTMTGLVARAEKRGLLLRAPNPADGRAVDVFLTPDGSDLAARLGAIVDEALSPMTSHLPPADQRRLQTLLMRMIVPDSR